MGLSKRETRSFGAGLALGLALAFAAFLIGSIAFAEFSCDYLGEGNTYHIWLPKSVTAYFSEETINLEFLMPQGNVLAVTGRVGRSGIGDLRCGSSREHGYFVSMTWREAVLLATSNTPITTFQQLRGQGKIMVVPNGIDKMQKLAEAEGTLPMDDGQPVPSGIQGDFGKYKSAAEGE